MRYTTFADCEDIETKMEEVASKESEEAPVGRTLTSVYKFINRLSGKKKETKKISSQSSLFAENGNNNEKREAADDVRDLWKTQFEFFFFVVGFMVGVGNFIKFPSLLYQHGGGVFLIPYFVCIALFGLPFVFLHLCVGQYSGLSASGAFRKLMPIAGGIGWALVILAFPVSIYYNIIVAWSIYYFWFSLRGFFVGGLPWSHCSPDWPSNTPCCLLQESSDCFLQPHAISSPEAYFHYEVLNRTPKIYPEEINETLSLLNVTLQDGCVLDPTLGPMQGHLVLALAFAWILVFFGVFKGVGSIGWAVTITSTLPYFLMVILLIRGLSLPGANDGLAFLFKPNIDKLWSIPMWKAAAEQVFYSFGIDAGPLISMASFSRYRNNIYRDSVIVVILNTFTSVLAGMVIFSFIGFLAHNQNQPVDAILRHDSLYIAFTVYPGATSFMEVMGPLWAALFFAMLTLSAVDAEFAWLEMIVSSLMKQFCLTSRRAEIRLVVGTCLVCFFCGLPLTARGGIFVFHSVENLNANWNSFTLSLLQIIVICYIYGVENFVEDIGEMLRAPLSLEDALQSQNLSLQHAGLFRKLKFFFGPTGGYIRWSWSFFSPLFLIFLLVASIVSYQRVTLEDYPLPFHYELVAWFAMITPLGAVPIIAIHSLCTSWKTKRSLKPVFDSSKWRHKHDGDNNVEPKHLESDDHEYWYIRDAPSRVASARAPNLARIEEGDYSRIVDLINGYSRKQPPAMRDMSEPDMNVVERASIQQFEQTEMMPSPVESVSNSPELTLFGAPPSIPVSDRSDTVIYRPRKPGSRVEEIETPFNVAKFNLAGPAMLPQALGLSSSLPRNRALSRASEASSDALKEKRHVSDDDITQPVRDIKDSEEESSALDDSSAASTLPSVLRSTDRFSTDHHSAGSISITPIDAPSRRLRRSSSASNADFSARPHRNHAVLMRPKPIDAPPAFDQL